MKKQLIFVLLTLLAISFLFAACGVDKNNDGKITTTTTTMRSTTTTTTPTTTTTTRADTTPNTRGATVTDDHGTLIEDASEALSKAVTDVSEGISDLVD